VKGDRPIPCGVDPCISTGVEKADRAVSRGVDPCISTGVEEADRAVAISGVDSIESAAAVLASVAPSAEPSPVRRIDETAFTPPSRGIGVLAA
jgi:hypothetical protein